MIEPMARTAERTPKVIASMEGGSVEVDVEKGGGVLSGEVLSVGRRSEVEDVEDMVDEVLVDMEGSTEIVLTCWIWNEMLELC